MDLARFDAASFAPRFHKALAADPAEFLLPPRPASEARTEDERLSVSVHVSMAALEADWRALEASSSASLHQGFDWCAAWAAAHHNPLLLLRGRIGARTVFILPLELVRGRLFRTARFIGSPHSNLNTGLFSDDLGPFTPEMLAEMLLAELCAKLERVADIVTLEKMPFDWRGHRHPLASLPSVRNQNCSYQLPMTASFTETLSQVNARRRRKKQRVSEKRLEALGGYEHVVAETPGERQALLERFFEQKATRFKAMGLPNVFADSKTQTFLRSLVAAPKAPTHKLLELHAIRLKGESEGRIAAIAGMSRKGDHVICQFGSIDNDLASEASPGELLFYRMIEDGCDDGIRLFDFGIGDQPYKRSWCTVETTLRDIVLPLTLRGRAAAALHRALVHAKALIKSNRHSYAFIQRLRQRRQAGRYVPPVEEADEA